MMDALIPRLKAVGIPAAGRNAKKPPGHKISLAGHV